MTINGIFILPCAGAGCFGPMPQNEFLHRMGIRQRIEVSVYLYMYRTCENKNYEIFDLYLVLIMDYWWVWSCQSASAKLRTMKFLLKGREATPRNFAPVKISHYMVLLFYQPQALMKGASSSQAQDLVSSYEVLTSPKQMGQRFKFLSITSNQQHIPTPFNESDNQSTDKKLNK